MNILVNGAGAIGIAIAASMISQGANVSFYARGETANKIKSEGIKREGIFKHYSYNSDKYHVYDDYKKIPKNTFDFVFVCSKTIVNEEISYKLNENKDILKEDFRIIIFQNGFGNDEPYLKYFSKNQVYCARVITGFQRSERNISKVTVHTEPILIGSLQKADTSSVEIIVDMISASGIPSETTENIAAFLWAKILYNCSLNPLGAILGVNYGKLIENQYSISIMNHIIAEIFNVMEAAGYKTNWENPEDYKKIFYSKLVPDTYNHQSSTLQDIQRKKKTEIDSLNGKVIAIGEKYGVNVKVNKTIYNLIKTIEADF